MPPNGPDEWRARIGHWENRKLRWYQAHCGSRPRVPLLSQHLKQVISDAPVVCVLLLLCLARKVSNAVLSSPGKLGRCSACVRRGSVWAMPLLSVLLALSLLLVVAGDVETNPGPISDKLLAEVDDSELSGKDTCDVYHEVNGLAGSWSSMCLALGLLPSDQSAIAAAHPGNPHDCLQAVIVKWLQKDYDYQRHGRPSWRMLVKAVGDLAGGNHNALAVTIANKHSVIKKGILIEKLSCNPNESCQAQLSESQTPVKHLRQVEEMRVKNQEFKEFISTSMGTQSISDEEWDRPTEFAAVLTKIAKQLNTSAEVEVLKCFLEAFGQSDTGQRHISIKLYSHCKTPQEIIMALVPQYINFMHTPILWGIVNEFGNEQSKCLLKQYEDNFPYNKPLKQMCDPIAFEEMVNCPGSKSMNILCALSTNTTWEDIERIRQILGRKIGINECMIVYANHTPESFKITFLIPETVVTFLTDLDEDSRRDLANHGIHQIEVNDLVIDLKSLLTETTSDTSQVEINTDALLVENSCYVSQAESKTDISQAEAKIDTAQTETSTDVKTKCDTLEAKTNTDTSQVQTETNTSRAETKADTSQKETEASRETKSDASQAETKAETETDNSWSLPALYQFWSLPVILQSEVVSDTFQAETKSNTSKAELKNDKSQTETKIDTSQVETVSGSSQADTMIDTLHLDTKADTSTYTASGMKRVPLSLEPLTSHYNSEFQQLIFEVGTLLAASVETSALKQFLQSFGHILYPETQYIDPKVLKDAESIPQIFFILQPQVINFLNWGIVWKAFDAYGLEIPSVFQLYKSRFPPITVLSSLPDPLSEKEISEVKGFQKLRVTVSGEDSGIQWTLGDVQAVREAVEKAAGIDQDFIIYAYWEGGFSTHQFTFLIPKSISGIFGELCEEDLTILAGKGVQRLEVDYDTIANNIQELYKELPQVVAPDGEDSGLRTKGFGLKHLILEDVVGPSSKEEVSYLNDLITSTPARKLHETCSNNFLKEFAKKMGNWKDLAPYFGINQYDLEDLAEMYPADEVEQKYVALLNWKTNSDATYERLVVGLLTHRHVEDAEEVLLHLQGSEVKKGQEILRKRFLKDIFSKRKLWFGAPKLPKFDRKFGIVQNTPLLSELDYTLCHEMMDQFPSEIQELSMKSMLNKITQRESRVFIFKGPPGCGKSELMSRLCCYWARQYALRVFSLVLCVNVWDLHQGCSLQELIDRQFKGSSTLHAKICQRIKKENGSGVLFILDGFCHQYLYKSPLKKGSMLYEILSGHRCYSNSTVVIVTTYSDFVIPTCRNYIQFEVLGLSDEQIGRQAIQHFDRKNAIDFLNYLSENLEIKGLVSSPSHLIGTIYIFAHISYDDLPMTWTQLYTSLVVLISKWHEGKVSKCFNTDSLQSQFKHTLLESSRKTIKHSGDLIATIGTSLIHDSKASDHKLPDHNCAMPYLEYFLSSLETVLNFHYKKIDKALKNRNAFAYFWYFLAGFGDEIGIKQLLKEYYERNILQIAKCVSKTGCMMAKQRTDLSCLTTEIGRTIITTRDIHNILHCLPYMQDPHILVFNKCFLGTQAVRELSQFLATDSWTNEYSGISHLCLTGFSDEAVSAIAVALKTNHSLQTLNLAGISDKAVIAIAVILKTNSSLKTLSVTGVSDRAVIAIAMTLETNHSLKTLNLRDNDLTDTGAIVLASTLRQNNSLEELNLGGNTIEDSGASALADTLRVNQMLKTLNLRGNGLPSTGAEALARALQHNQSLKELILEGNRIENSAASTLADSLRVNQSLKTLNLKENRIEDTGASSLADTLRVNQSLKALDLRDNYLTATGAIALARALLQNKSLEILNLDCTDYHWTGIKDDGATALADLRVITNFKTLNLGNNDLTDTGTIALAVSLKLNRSLEELNLEWNVLSSEGATALANTLEVNQSLKTLNLRGNNLMATGAIALARALKLNSSLEELNLEQNGIKCEGASALADALRVNKSLKTLILESNGIQCEGASTLANALRVNNSMKTLNLRDNDLTCNGVLALAKALKRNKSLQELNFDCTYYQWTGIGDEGATALADLRVIKNFAKLNLRGNGVTATGVMALARALKYSKSLKELILDCTDYHWTGIGDDGATALADLRVLTNFKTLNLRENDLTETGAVALARGLQLNKSLEELNLESNRIQYEGAAALADALRVNKSLKTLNLESNWIQYEGAAALADALRVNKSLKTLNLKGNNLIAIAAITLAEALQQNKSLEELNLDWNRYQWTRIGDRGATALADLRVIKNFKVLNLRNSGMTATGALVLFRALQHINSLEELNLEQIGIGDSGAAALVDTLRANKSLKTLNLRNNGLTAPGAIALARALQQIDSLEELNLEQNRFGDSGATELADVMRVNKSFRTLNLKSTGLSNTGAIALARALQCSNSVEELDLGWNKIGSEGAIALADVLQVNQSLKTLNLGYNVMTPAGAKALARALQHNNSLEELDLDQNILGQIRIDDSAAIELANALRVNTTLKRLKLRGLRRIQETTRQLLTASRRIFVSFRS